MDNNRLSILFIAIDWIISILGAFFLTSWLMSMWFLYWSGFLRLVIGFIIFSILISVIHFIVFSILTAICLGEK